MTNLLFEVPSEVAAAKRSRRRRRHASSSSSSSLFLLFPICGFSPERNSISCGKRRWVGTKKRREGEFIPLWCIYSPKRRAEVAIFCCCFFKRRRRRRGGLGTGEYIGGAIFPPPKRQTDNSIHKWKIEKSSPATGNRSECSWVSIKKTKS